MATESYISVNESHAFVFPVLDFNGQASGTIFAGTPLKLPSEGDWWCWGVVATRVATGAVGELASGSMWNLNIWDPGLSQYWWTGGSLDANQVLPITSVAGKAGNPGFFTEPKLIKAGSTLVPYVSQTSGGTPSGSSQAYVCLIVTLASSSTGGLPIMPSLDSFVNQNKGAHYKALVKAGFAASSLAVGATRQFTLPLNKESAYIISQLNTDLKATDTTFMDPTISDQGVLVNMFDTRTTWKWATPQGIPFSLFLGYYAARPFAAPSYFYMEAGQNLALEVTNNSTATLTTDMNVIMDGYLQEGILGTRVKQS